jgi:predicted nucleotidyltransferase
MLLGFLFGASVVLFNGASYPYPMRPSQALDLYRSQIRGIALRHRVTGVSAFGSAIHGDDVEGSDLDLLVEPTSATTLLDIGAIRHELKALLGIEVDVLTPNGLPARFREQVLSDAVLL